MLPIMKWGVKQDVYIHTTQEKIYVWIKWEGNSSGYLVCVGDTFSVISLQALSLSACSLLS